MMRKKIIAVLDREERYAEKLMEAFNSKKQLGFQAEMFTSVEAYWEYTGKNQVEILLIGECYMEKSLEHSAELILLISEGQVITDESPGYPILYKYQSSEIMIRKVFEYYAKEGKTPEKLGDSSIKVYGVYAPQGRRCKSGFAWNLAKWMGREKHVLYLGLTTFSFKQELYEGNKELADIMYHVRQDFENLIYLVSSVVTTIEGVDCMPPMKAIEDLIHVPCEDWIKLIQVICGQSNYEVLIMDLEECVQQFYRLLELCTEVYLPYLETDKDRFKWDLCEQYFQIMGAEEIWRKGKRLEVDRQYWRSGMENIIGN